MPIRFRCAYCNQLMAIATRKAGTVVRCPTCAGQVVVPNVQPSAQQAPAKDKQPAAGAVFERSDFDELFQNPAAPPPATQPPGFPLGAEPAPAPPPGPGFDVEPLALGGAGRVRPGGQPAGLFLTTAKGVLLALIVAVLLGLAFLAGLLVGQAG